MEISLLRETLADPHSELFLPSWAWDILSFLCLSHCLVVSSGPVLHPFYSLNVYVLGARTLRDRPEQRRSVWDTSRTASVPLLPQQAPFPRQAASQSFLLGCTHFSATATALGSQRSSYQNADWEGPAGVLRHGALCLDALMA